MTTEFRMKNTVNLKRFTDRMLKDRKEKLEQALQEAARGIVTRTQSGEDMNGGAFAPYDPDYKDWKMGVKTKGAKKWRKFMTTVGGRSRSPKAGRTGHPNLTLSGRMLQAVQTTVEAIGSQLIGKIFIPSGEEAAKARYNQPKRPFFGLSDEQKQAIINKLK